MSHLLALHSASWFPWLLDMLLKSAVLLALAGMAALACRRASAAQRHCIWTLAVIGALLLPVLSTVLPAWRVVRLPVWQPNAIHVQTITPPATREAHQPSPATLTAEVEVPGVSSSVPAERPEDVPAAQSPRISSARTAWPWYAWAMFAWFIGSVLVLAWWMYGYALAHRLRHQVRPAPPAWVGEMPAGVRLLVSDHIAIPVVVGLLCPTILLPAQAEDWPEERRRVVLLHELAHIRRGDLCIHLLAQLACALYWMNPFIWLATHRMRVEREVACDDAVLNAEIRASDYAAHLLAIAGARRERRVAPIFGIAMARSAEIEKRITRLLDEQRNRRGMTRLAGSMIIMPALALSVVLAVAQEPDAKPSIHYPDPPVHIAFAQKQVMQPGYGVSLLHDSPYPVLSPDGGRVLFLANWGWEIDGKEAKGDEVFQYHRDTGLIENLMIPGRSRGRFHLWLAPTHLNRVSWDGRLTTDKIDPEAVISPDGRWEAWFKQTIETVGNPPTQMYTFPLTLVNRETGAEERIEVPDASGTRGDVRPLKGLQFSQDGRYLTFSAQYGKVWENSQGGGGSFSWLEAMVYDRINKQLAFANVNEKGERVSVPCSNPHISTDGRYVLFQAFRHDGYSSSDPPEITNWREQQRLSDEDTALVGGYYLYNTQTKRVQRYRRRLDALAAARAWFYPFTSRDGRYVVTEIKEQGQAPAIRLQDTETGEEQHLGEGGRQFAEQLGLPYLSHEYPSISADGRYISYVTRASNIKFWTDNRTPGDPGWEGVIHLATAIQVFDRISRKTSTVLVAMDLLREHLSLSALPQATIAVKGDAYVDMPIWVYITFPKMTGTWPPSLRYPFTEYPRFIWGHDLEVIKDGMPLPRREPAFPNALYLVGVDGGSAAPPTSPTGRLPLHVFYRFAQPGTYHLRYVWYGPSSSGPDVVWKREDGSIVEN